MIALLQRVISAQVSVAAEANWPEAPHPASAPDNAIKRDITGRIDHGLLALIGVQKGDSLARARRMCERIAAYRVFEDPQGRMNLSLEDIGGGLLLVPQFTLAADTSRGNRPSFTPAASPELAEALFDQLVKHSRERLPRVEIGRFGADMQVSLTNDGPVTFWLES